MKLVEQYMTFFFNFFPTSNHLHSLQAENCDSNSRLVVDEDDYGKFRLERVKTLNQCWYNARPQSARIAQHWIKIGSTHRVFLVRVTVWRAVLSAINVKVFSTLGQRRRRWAWNEKTLDERMWWKGVEMTKNQGISIWNQIILEQWVNV